MRAALVVVTLIAALRTSAVAAPSAEDLYTEGQAAYDRADYPTAIARWRASYEISGEPGLLFNLAQALRLSGDCPGALSTYRKFVAADPDPTSEQHRLAEDLARELDATCDEPPPISIAPVEPPAAIPARELDPDLDLAIHLSARDDRTPRPGRTLRIAGLAVGGTGVALLVTGLVVGRHARSLGDEVTTTCASGCDWAVQKSKDAAGKRAATIGYALDAVGVAAITGGAIMYYVGLRRISVAPRPSEDGAVISWSGSW
jgi:tetratricopeptide (TPR) repeat protein